MSKHQIKMLTSQQLSKLSTKWLHLIASKHSQFGAVSDRAVAELVKRGIKCTLVKKGA